MIVLRTLILSLVLSLSNIQAFGEEPDYDEAHRRIKGTKTLCQALIKRLQDPNDQITQKQWFHARMALDRGIYELPTPLGTYVETDSGLDFVISVFDSSRKHGQAILSDIDNMPDAFIRDNLFYIREKMKEFEYVEGLPQRAAELVKGLSQSSNLAINNWNRGVWKRPDIKFMLESMNKRKATLIEIMPNNHGHSFKQWYKTYLKMRIAADKAYKYEDPTKAAIPHLQKIINTLAEWEALLLI